MEILSPERDRQLAAVQRIARKQQAMRQMDGNHITPEPLGLRDKHDADSLLEGGLSQLIAEQLQKETTPEG